MILFPNQNPRQEKSCGRAWRLMRLLFVHITHQPCSGRTHIKFAREREHKGDRSWVRDSGLKRSTQFVIWLRIPFHGRSTVSECHFFVGVGGFVFCLSGTTLHCACFGNYNSPSSKCRRRCRHRFQEPSQDGHISLLVIPFKASLMQCVVIMKNVSQRKIHWKYKPPIRRGLIVSISRWATSLLDGLAGTCPTFQSSAVCAFSRIRVRNMHEHIFQTFAANQASVIWCSSGRLMCALRVNLLPHAYQA